MPRREQRQQFIYLTTDKDTVFMFRVVTDYVNIIEDMCIRVYNANFVQSDTFPKMSNLVIFNLLPGGMIYTVQIGKRLKTIPLKSLKTLFVNELKKDRKNIRMTTISSLAEKCEIVDSPQPEFVRMIVEYFQSMTWHIPKILMSVCQIDL